MTIIELEEVDSTNEFLKRGNFEEDAAVIAKRQTSGRGTKGRSFVSEEGGLYISLLRFYNNFPASNAFQIMINSSVAVCKTLEFFGIKPTIRWANDVLAGGRKICGTLIENTFSGAYICRSIVGMGLNVNNVLPAELKDIAVSMREISKKEFVLEEVKTELLKNLERGYNIADYKKYIDWFGKEVTIHTAQGAYSATALDITNEGRLLIKRGKNQEEISSAEVSLRI